MEVSHVFTTAPESVGGVRALYALHSDSVRRICGAADVAKLLCRVRWHCERL